MTLLAGVDVSRETMERLERFAALTRKWNPSINLVAKSTIPDLWDRHIVDSVQLYPLAPARPRHWLDIGSGGGFPGIIMAAISAEKSPETRFTFIESDQRKSTFLRTAARELGLRVNVIASRIEETEPQSADVVSARALSALTDLLPLISLHLAPDGTAILPKGKTHQQEIDVAKEVWSFDVASHQSMTDEQARILVVKGISRD
ncbi:MAG: 16S rRNA (guanine(527)-N(7))-methyltransferase RsmG [Yoonia sp.]|nr:16S rRNA (guanine(527)-N(7))-methyltransferase RsmG [Yoonia sp.]